MLYDDIIDSLPELEIVQLETLSDEVNAVYTNKVNESEGEALQEVEKLLASKGLTGKYKLEKKSSNTAKRTVSVKYQNPDNPNEVWSGRGVLPKWIKEYAVANGVQVPDKFGKDQDYTACDFVNRHLEMLIVNSRYDDLAA